MHQILKDTHIIKACPDILVKIFTTIGLTHMCTVSHNTWRTKIQMSKNTIKREKKIKHSKCNIIKASQNSVIDKI